MPLERRDFLKCAGAAVTAGAFSGPLLGRPTVSEFGTDPNVKALALLTLDEARRLGAEYADVRIGRHRLQHVATSERRCTSVTDTDSTGLGVRVLLAGTWGFAATNALTRMKAVTAVRRAADDARAHRASRRYRVVLAPSEAHVAKWRSSAAIDPWSVPLDEKVALLLDVNDACLALGKVRYVTSAMFFVKEVKTFANSDGAMIEQTVLRTWAPVSITASSSDGTDYQCRDAAPPPAALGYEAVERGLTRAAARRWAEEAVAKLSARSVAPGRYDLVLAPSHLWLTIHESIGHPTELDDRESFVAPPARVIGRLRYGPAFMNVKADRRQPGSLAQAGYDDEGVPADEWLLIREGIFVDYPTTRQQASRMAGLTGLGRSHGCAHADSWSSAPCPRMPNVSLLPGEQDLSAADLIAATDRGIYIEGDAAFAIDRPRARFRFSGQVCQEIRGGRLVGYLRDVSYTARTVEFWNAMDIIGGRGSYELYGAFFDGKGRPGQLAAVSHGCPPARFRGVRVVGG